MGGRMRKLRTAGTVGAVALVGLFTCLTANAQVVINGSDLPAADVGRVAQQIGYVIPDGHYWYDRLTGAWGREGQGTAGFTQPSLSLGGALRADASAGRTGAFINGRELAESDVAALTGMGIPVYRGRYWVDAAGNGGIEGAPASFNLYSLAQQAAAAGRGSIYAKSGYGDNKSATWIGADGSLSHSTTVNGKTYDYYIGD